MDSVEIHLTARGLAYEWASFGPARAFRLNHGPVQWEVPHDDDRPELWAILRGDELETIAPDYVWAAENGDEAERFEFAVRLVTEAKRRGKPEIIDRARAWLVQPEIRASHLA